MVGEGEAPRLARFASSLPRIAKVKGRHPVEAAPSAREVSPLVRRDERVQPPRSHCGPGRHEVQWVVSRLGASVSSASARRIAS